MAFPTTLDDLDSTRGSATEKLNSPSHSTHHAAEDTLIESIQAKVGANSSAVITSLDYLLKNSSSSNPGHKHTLAHGATNVTATYTELNYVGGVTSAIQAQIDGKSSTATVNTHIADEDVHLTTAQNTWIDNITASYAELNILDGVTASSGEINILDGAILSTNELNILNGVIASSAELNIMNGVTASSAEINILDGVTASSGEINKLDGALCTTTELNYIDGLTSSAQTQLDGKANLALSNLVLVTINTSLISDTNNTDDLGSSSKKWKDLYLSGTATVDGNLALTGAIATPTNVSMTGELDMTGAGITVDLNPSGAVTVNIIDITPSAAIGNLAVWKGVYINGTALDPSAADAEVCGYEIDFSGVSESNVPLIHGIRVDVPEDSDAIHIAEGQLHIDTTLPSTIAAEFTGIDMVIDSSAIASTSDYHALDVATTGTPSGNLVAIGTHTGVSPINQHIGSFTTPDQSTPDAYAGRKTGGGITWADGIDGTTIFTADNDSIYVGSAAEFSEIEVIMTTGATKNVTPTIWYNTAATAWTQFFPADDTDGFQQSGEIRWDLAGITGSWTNDGDPGAGDTSPGYWIKITRTRNGTVGSPVPATVKTAAITEYSWDKDGDITALNLDLAGTATVTGNITGAKFGGINSANLVDKSTTEAITGTWTLDDFSGTASTLVVSGDITAGADINVTGTATITGKLTAATHGGITEANLVDKSAAETIAGTWVLNDFSGTASTLVVSDSVTVGTISVTTLVRGSVSDAEFSYLEDVTSSIQAQLDSKVGVPLPPTDIASGIITTAEFEYLDGLTSTVQVQLDAKVGVPLPPTSIANGLITTAEFDYLDGLSSTIQAQLDSKLESGFSPTGIANGLITTAEFEFLDGITSTIQTQLDAKTDTKYSASTGISLTGTAFSSDDSAIDHNELSNYAANEHIDWTGASVDLVTSGSATITGNVTGAKVGGITQANLVDKSDTETITGTWTLESFSGSATAISVSGNIDVTGTAAITDNATVGGDIDVTGDVGGATIGGITEANLVDKAATETITGTWTLESFSGTASSLEVTGAAYFDAEYNIGNAGAGTFAVDWSNGNKQLVTLDQVATTAEFTAPNGVCNLILKLIIGTTSATMTWPSTVKWPAGTAPTLTTTAAAIDIMSFYYNKTDYYGNSSLAFA